MLRHIIPFKAKAWLDLTQRKDAGQHIDSKDIKKHKNDIFRLSLLLSANQHQKLPKEIEEDMKSFLEKMKTEEIHLKQLGIHMFDKSSILSLISQIYEIKDPC